MAQRTVPYQSSTVMSLIVTVTWLLLLLLGGDHVARGFNTGNVGSAPPAMTSRNLSPSSTTKAMAMMMKKRAVDDANEEDDSIMDDDIVVFNTGDALLDRRLALVRTVAMASAATATATAASGLTANPAHALGRNELAINGLQSDPAIAESKNKNGDPTKHTPVVSLVKDSKGYGQILTVEIPHVMDFDKPHYIEYVWLQDVTKNPNDVRIGNIIAAESFTKPRGKAAGIPVVAKITANVASGNLPTKSAYLTKSMTVKPCSYCNLHGLWEGEPISLSG